MMDREERGSVSRRTFVKGSALAGLAGGGALTLFGCSSASGVEKAELGDAAGQKIIDEKAKAADRIVWNHCAINCPGRCALKLHVKDDEIIRVETYSKSDDPNEGVQPRACLRGRAYRAWVNHPDRINYPMKRVEGTKRGDMKYERISWEEAISIIAENYKAVLEEYGPEAVYVNYASGTSSTTARPWNRLFNLLGGYVSYYGSYSTAQISWISPYIYGKTGTNGSTLAAAEDSDLILMFGTSPVETRQGGAVSHYDYVKMRARTDAKIYVIDPRHNDSLSGFSDEWLPINPGTDAALVSAIAHELITTDRVNKDFLDTCCVGYDEETLPESAKGKNRSYKDYIMGTGYDMVEKTAEWAAPLTGISVEKIKSLATEIAEAKALFVDQGWGPQRRSNGEMTAAAICMLPILTGQIGLPGTSNGLREGSYSIGLTSLPNGKNPVEAVISVFTLVHSVERGSDMTEKADGVRGVDHLKTGIKFMVNWAGNCITNQNSDINWIHDVMSDDTNCKFIFGSDITMTDSLKYCDVILPDSFRLEQDSMIGTGGSDAYMIAGTEPYPRKFERKTSYDAAALLAEAMGVGEEFTEGKSQVDWIKELYEASREKDPELPTYEEAREMGVYTRENPKGKTITLEAFRKDPVANPLETPSGKIEIYSEKLAEHIETHEFPEDDFVAPVPVYATEWYGIENTTDQYPLMLCDFHYRGRIHSSWGGVELLKELNPQELWINPEDAESRGIAEGDTVRVNNEFGEIELLAKVTPRIIPGTVGCAQGAWHDADMNGDRVDKGGCSNTLATHRPSPLAKGNPQHTNICEVRKA